MTAISEQTSAPTFDSLDPSTGDIVGTYSVHDADHVDAVVAKAKEAADWWGGLGFAERGKRLRAWAGVLTRRINQLADVVHAETGKPHSDATLEVALVLDHIAWAAKHAPKVLGRKRVSSGLVMSDHSASVEYLPLGVIGVIGPWNYPVFTPLGSITYALAAGNAVVFKPSEYTPGVGAWLVDAFAQVVPEQPVLQLITGFGPTGEALCRSGVDKIAFTGSPGTGRKIMHACADTLTPVVIEGGGKDALLVDADADIAKAADAAVWGGLANAGQTCVGVERVYVHEQVYDAFVKKVTDLVEPLRAGSDASAKIGPMTMPSQPEVVRRHIADALERGGRAIIGGLGAVGERFVQPTVLVDVPRDSLANTDETFGPTLTVARVASMDEAVELANDSKYGLGATVFSKKRGKELARRIRSGMTAVNSVIAFAAIPSLPFGGIGESGFGRIHGPDGLREFTYAKAVASRRMPGLMNLTSFARTASNDKTLTTLANLLHGRG
ncbi:aldehyde dehydrogenase family protein [Nocardia sp. NPDC050710]|uniref:aldehyde dehydrogenase family protein n=1 Tax=Nocardia sp. NPDC050710 TaxID=3157220 RepID=UPI0033DCA0CE